MTVSMRDAAEDVATIECCACVPARFAEPITQRRARNPFLGWQTEATVIRAWRLRDVVLDRALMVLLRDGQTIAETNYLQDPAAVAKLRVRHEALVVVDPGCPVISCCDHWDANYYHWVAHTLPTLHAVVQRHPRGDAVLLLPPLAAWQARSLDLIGAAHLPRITMAPGRQYFLPVAEYHDFVAGRADFAVSAVSRAAYRRMSDAVGAAARPAGLIYIDRGSAANRTVPNEAALGERLRAAGFHAVRPETLSVDQQIALFRGAAMVVGQLGAGLANIAFCETGTVVYELIPEHHRNPCFLAMAMQGDLQYWADVFPTGVQGEDHTSAWSVPIDVDQVMRRVAELMSLIPASRRPR